jgi:hypothetical protein
MESDLNSNESMNELMKHKIQGGMLAVTAKSVEGCASNHCWTWQLLSHVTVLNLIHYYE